ncbi:hypothetical protein SprV_0702394400 [Sparganum proliferum]
MSVSYLLAGILVFLVLSAESGEANIQSLLNAEPDQSQNDDLDLENEDNDKEHDEGYTVGIWHGPEPFETMEQKEKEDDDDDDD